MECVQSGKYFLADDPDPDAGLAAQVCKTGANQPFSKVLKNVVIMGDSVSIGYAPKVQIALVDIALVQHSPWGGDGGAEETEYGWRCLEYLLRAPDGTPQVPDVLWFNWGLHNIGHGQTKRELRWLVYRLTCDVCICVIYMCGVNTCRDQSTP